MAAHRPQQIPFNGSYLGLSQTSCLTRSVPLEIVEIEIASQPRILVEVAQKFPSRTLELFRIAFAFKEFTAFLFVDHFSNTPNVNLWSEWIECFSWICLRTRFRIRFWIGFGFGIRFGIEQQPTTTFKSFVVGKWIGIWFAIGNGIGIGKWIGITKRFRNYIEYIVYFEWSL